MPIMSMPSSADKGMLAEYANMQFECVVLSKGQVLSDKAHCVKQVYQLMTIAVDCIQQIQIPSSRGGSSSNVPYVAADDDGPGVSKL